jgi:hypothetical protein
MYKSENFLLTFCASPPPSPRWGEGKGEGKFQMSLVRISIRIPQSEIGLGCVEDDQEFGILITEVSKFVGDP